METHFIVLSTITLAFFVLFVGIGIAQCFFVTEHSCSRINGACPAVWAPFIYVTLPYSIVYGCEKNQVWKWFSSAILFSTIPSVIALLCSMADAICTEIHDDKIALTWTQIIAVTNATFAVPLCFASISLIAYLSCAYLPKNYASIRENEFDRSSQCYGTNV